MSGLAWSPPGPVSAAFLEAQEPITNLMGPIGGGKTTTCLWRGVVESYLWPETSKGLRRVKFGVVRRLYKDLEKTTMASWNEWFPRTMGNWRGAAGDPATHDLVLPHPSGRGRVELRVEFIALGDRRVEEALRGWEVSYVFIDEVDTAADNTLSFCWTRAGRFPRETLAINPKKVWSACNAPEEDNHIVEDFINDPKPGYRMYRQPSGLSADAENIKILGPEYYRRMAAVLKPYERKRFVENIPGLSRNAEAVYDEFNLDLHVSAEPLAVLPGRDLIVGMDAGGTPAAVIMQIAPNGQRRFLAELSTHAKEHGSITGPNRFGEVLGELLAEQRFRGCRVRGIADPSAQWGADTANGESSWVEIVSRVAGIPVTPAPTNDPTIRQEALRVPMTRMIDGRHPGLIVCVTCKLLKRAFASDYRHQVTAGRRTGILKNWASHAMEAAQYGALDGGAYHEILARQRTRQAAMRPIVAQTAFNPV